MTNYDTICTKCSGLIARPGKTYGWGGTFCHCEPTIGSYKDGFEDGRKYERENVEKPQEQAGWEKEFRLLMGRVVGWRKEEVDYELEDFIRYLLSRQKEQMLGEFVGMYAGALDIFFRLDVRREVGDLEDIDQIKMRASKMIKRALEDYYIKYADYTLEEVERLKNL